MNRQSYILKIDKPCGQEWSSMTKTNIGKFCSHCCKTVVDFTQLSDNEVLQIIEQNSGKLCGRLTQEQLNRAIQSSQPRNNSRLYKILAGLMLIGSSENSLAIDSQKLQPELISIVENNNTNVQLTETKSEQAVDSLKNVVQGLVFDSITKEPISFSTIYIKDTKIGTMTDFDGKFRFVIPDNLITEKISLVIESIGYKKTEIVINENELPINKNLAISPSLTLLGDVIIVKKKKWWQRR